MPYSRPFVKVRINGIFGISVATAHEKWSTGFNISSLGGGSFDPANLLTFLGNAAPYITNFHSSSAVKAGSYSWVTQLTAAYIGTDGLYVLGSLQPTTVFDYVTPVSGSGSPVHNQSTAIVISLRSLRLRGPASHGRMYWPATSATLPGTDGTLGTTFTNAYAAAAKTMIDSVNGVASSTFGSGSKIALVSKVGAGAEAIVTKIMVDQKLDHMESRERSIASVYSSSVPAVAAAAIAERDDQLRQAYDNLEHE